jgi:hypothetical protein
LTFRRASAANVDERDVVPNLYDKVHGLLIGDKGFISGGLKAEAHEIDLQTPLRKNMPGVLPARLRKFTLRTVDLGRFRPVSGCLGPRAANMARN